MKGDKTRMSVKQKDRGMSADTAGELNFAGLVDAIRTVHEQLSRHAAKAVNISLTVRNWMIGCYIREYEQHGADRAEYGRRLLQRLSERLPSEDAFSHRSLKLYRQFYDVYGRIGQTLPAHFQQMRIGQTPSAQLPFAIQNSMYSQLIEPAALRKADTLPATPNVPPERLLTSLSFSHFTELMKYDDPLKRVFYEVECINGNWSVRELKRQMASLYFERCGLSKNKKALSRLTQAKAEADSPQLVIRDPYVFEFLGLKPKEVMHESTLEDALLGKVQDFLLELGRGFCFEARQKRILIGGEYFFVDLVFYHRILRCHVLFELKADSFKHEHLGQLNSYVGWYKEHEMMEGDNPPVGILLCTAKNHALVKYALAGMDSRLFVSQYQLKLPSVEELRAFVEQTLREDA